MGPFTSAIAQKLQLRLVQVEAVLALLEAGSSIPFIARYRKDSTGGMDEVQIAQVKQEAALLQELSDRKAFIVQTITTQGNMTAALQQKIEKANTLAALEDIYLPYKPKRKTRGQAAREKGLEPLAHLLLQEAPFDLMSAASHYIGDALTDVEMVLQGARDIVAEEVNEDATVRARLRKLFEGAAALKASVIEGHEAEAIKFKDYFNFSEPISKIPSHRVLAVLRGFLEGHLRVELSPDEALALDSIEEIYLHSPAPQREHVKRAIRDAYRRLLQPSLETEFRAALKMKADEDAIDVFAGNLRQLLLGAPLGNKRLLAIDPGYRSGCKVVCLDEKGELVATALIFPHDAARMNAAGTTIRQLVTEHGVEVIAVGDGTAGRETEQFIRSLALGLPVFLVNEDGASIYSASEAGREEFPNEDITVRGAVSIGRRLADPLAELVKLDPKSIGVGQYQHDVNQARLKERLDVTVVSCVNAVGVNLNTASRHLLAYVSGIGPTVAKNIVTYRNEIGRFSNRRELLSVPRLGAAAFEQCAGFLRIRDGEQILDASSVHPEAYLVVQQIAQDLGVELKSLVGNEPLLQRVDVKKYISGQIGELTIRDIIKELKKPGLDPRSVAEHFEFAAIYSIDDVKPGMQVPGVVTNITRFGAFVDIGVKQDGLVHVSEIDHRYIADPAEALKLNQRVQVKVLEVDVARKRIALSIRQTLDGAAAKQRNADRPSKKASMAQPALLDTSAGKAPAMADALSSLRQKFRSR